MERRITLALVLLVAVACTACAAPPEVTKPPLFAAAGESKQVFAIVPGTPSSVALDWGTGQVEMRQDFLGLYTAVIPGSAVEGTSLTYSVTAYSGLDAAKSRDYTLLISPTIPVVAAKPMKLSKSVVVAKAWGKDGFGADAPAEGAVILPAAIAADKKGIHLLDTVNARVLSFDKAGKLLGKADLPTATATDMVAAGDGLIVADAKGKAFKVAGGKASPAAAAKMGKAVLVEVEATSVKIGVAGSVVEVELGAQVLDAAETAVDGKGAAWVLVGVLEGDGVGYRLVKCDAKGNAGAAAIQTFIPGDTTRRMAGVDNGVVLFEGDSAEGRIVLYQ